MLWTRPLHLRWGGLFLVLLLGACFKPSVRGKKLSELVSPDGAMTITATVHDGALATVSTSYRVYVRSVHHPDPVLILVADHTHGPTLSWINDHTAQIAFKCGDIYSFTNFAELTWDNHKSYDNARFVLVDPGSCSDFRLPG